MATIVNTISNLIRAYNMPRTTPVLSNNPYGGKIPAGPGPDPELYKSALGTPVVADLTFLEGFYTNEETGRVESFEAVKLVTVLITVNQVKNIVRTEITGRPGSVKEYINLGDYQVTINGIITGPNGVYPASEVAALFNVCKAPISIRVVSRYLQAFEIFNIAIENYTFDQEPGGYSKQLFTLNCLSDKPVELIIQ